MEIFEKIVFFSHLVGFAAVAGGLLYQLSSKVRNIGAVILNGARWQALSGGLLYFLVHDEVRHPVAGLKILGVTAILAIAEMKRKDKQLSRNIYGLLLALVLLETVAAVFVATS